MHIPEHLPRPGFIVRHAQTEFNVHNSGRLDVGNPPLSELGERQAEELEPLVEMLGITAVVTAKNLRTVQTAATATYGLGIELHVDSGLNEFNWGTAAGKLQKEVFPAFIDESGEDKGLGFQLNSQAETCIKAGKRLLGVMDTWQQTDHKPLLVSSGHIIRSAVGLTMGLSRSRMLQYSVPHAQILWYDPRSKDYPVVVTTDNVEQFMQLETIIQDDQAA